MVWNHITRLGWSDFVLYWDTECPGGATCRLQRTAPCVVRIGGAQALIGDARAPPEIQSSTPAGYAYLLWMDIRRAGSSRQSLRARGRTVGDAAYMLQDQCLSLRYKE